MNPKTRKLLMTIRAALIMATKAIEEYCNSSEDVTIIPESDNSTWTKSTP